MIRKILLVAVAATVLTNPAQAQQARAGSSQMAYGARLNADGLSGATRESARVSRRLETRVNSRLATRVKHYALPDRDATMALAGRSIDGTDTLRRQDQPIAQAEGSVAPQ